MEVCAAALAVCVWRLAVAVGGKPGACVASDAAPGVGRCGGLLPVSPLFLMLRVFQMPSDQEKNFSLCEEKASNDK